MKLNEVNIVNYKMDIIVKDKSKINTVELHITHYCINSEIKGLEEFINLYELYLSDNRITEIKGLDTLVNLEILNLRNNWITEIKGLDTLVKLQNLNIYNNRINEIKGLEMLVNLRKLNLSNNPITEIKGLTTLIKLDYILLQDVKVASIDYMFIPDSVNFILYNQKDNIGEIRRIKQIYIKVKLEVVKIIFVKKCRTFLQKCRNLHPDSDYVNNVLKPRFEELKK